MFEQTISSSIANHAASDDEPEKQKDLLRKVRGRVVYQPKDVGWEVVKPLNDANNDISSSSSSIPISLQVKDFTDIRNIPFIHHFLPANYPHSVCPSYATYASYCFLGSVAGSSAMVLSTQALLVAVGVGTQSAAPMAAALNWVMKDGVGQLGGVLFASQLGKGGMDVDYWKNKIRKWSGPFYKSSKKQRGNFQRGTADSNPKRWRMVAALALDLSTLLEIFTPFFGPEYFLPCASIANIGKNIGFLAASASRAAIHQSLTKTEGKTSNLGDVTAKAIKTRTTITGVNATLQSLSILLDGKRLEEELLGIDTSAIDSAYIVAAGHIHLPLVKSFTSIQSIQIVFNNAGSQRTFEVISKTNQVSSKLAPTVKLYNGSSLADATIDIIVKGY